MSQQSNVLKSVGRAFGIIEHMHEFGSSSVTQLADEFDMPKSTLQMYLNTLYDERVLVKRDGKYELGYAFLQYGMGVLRSDQLFPVVKSKVEQLADQTGEFAACFVEERCEGVLIYGREGDQSINTDLSVGDRTDLHCGANGKVILAYLPESRVHEILRARGLKQKTENTITEEDELFAELDRIRERGYARSMEESIEGMRSIAAPILLNGDVVGSISLAGPANRFVGDLLQNDLPGLVTGAANEIELKLQYSSSGM